MLDDVIADRPRRRRLANALLAYGVVGTVLLGILLGATLYAGLQVQGWAERVSTARDEVVSVIGSARAALDQAAAVTETAGESVAEASGAIDQAAELARGVADGSASLKAIAEFEVLGRRPFASAGPALGTLATSSAALADTLASAGGQLGTGAERVEVLGQKIGEIEQDLAVIEARLAALDLDPGTSVLLAIIVAAALISWLLVQALAALGLGVRMRRS